MSFFYDLNKKLDSIRATPEVTHQQLNERDMSRAAKGYEKYGKQGMQALAKAGREGKALDPVRKKYDKYDNDQVDEDMYNQGGVYKEIEIEPKRPQQKEKGMTRGTRPGPEKSNKIFPPMRLPSDENFPPMRLPKGDERVFPPMRLPTDESGGPATVKSTKPAPAKPSKSAPKGEFMGTIKGGVWTADPPKRGEKGVPAPSGDPEGVKEGGYYDPAHDQAANNLSNSMTKPANTEPPTQIINKQEILKRAQEKANAAPPTQIINKQEILKRATQQGVQETGMTPKQKSFAKLAPPTDKITFADKIAGAKKEVDEMLGDVAAEAMRSALGGGRGRNAEMDEERSKGTAFDMSAPRAAKPKVGSVERGHKHDIKHTATGRMVTRRTDDQGISVGADDDSDTQAGPRGRGRPKGTKGAIGAKGPSGRSKLMTREGEVDITDQGEYDQEGDMAKDDIKTIVRHAQALSKVLGDNDNLPEWVQSKLSKIEGMMISIDEYMQNQEGDDDREEPIAEKAVSKQQQKFMGMAHAMQKGEKIKGASKELKKVAKTMKPKDTEDFAKTKHKGLPDKVKKKEVDEDSDEGRLKTTKNTDGTSSTSSTTGRINATLDKGKVEVKPAKSSSGMSFGKGIYDSMNRELEQMIAESMSINMSDSTEGNKSLTVTATDDDAMKLAMMLKSAGLGGQGRELQSDESCPTCGMPDCGCGDVQEAVDENSPDWPTNTETSDDALQYAGGLNKPKTDVAGDGQTTIPNTAVHTQDEDALRRMMEMAGLAEAAKPDFLDMDKDGDKEESMKDAVKDKEEDSVDESIQRMREMAGIREAKKDVDEEKTEEGNLFTGNLAKARADGKKQADLDGDGDMEKVRESIFTLTNQWKTYKG